MRVLGPGSLAVLLAAISLTANGCCKKEKEQIAILQSQYNDLSNQNMDLKARLAQANTRESELMAQLAEKDAQISDKGQEVLGLQAKLEARPVTRSPGEWDIGRYADRIVVGSDILFASGQASLTAAGKARLDKIVGDLKRNYSGMTVRVYGYTDSDPIRRSKKLWDDNLDLSANRAMAVSRYLTAEGISSESIETIAMGATHFVAENTAAANKAKNRRVEIVVIKQ